MARKPVVIQPRMPVGPQGPKGEPAPNVKIQYSADNSNWHDAYQQGDAYIRFSTDGGTTWGDGMAISTNADTLDGYQATDFVLVTDYEDTDVLNKIKNVDGAGSGLDADTVDGLHASEIVMTANDILTELKTVDGAGSGLDADLVRGLPADFTISKTENGYTKLPNGLIIQWGVVGPGSSGVVTINYPVAFPNAAFLGVAQMINDSFTIDSNSAAWYPISNTQCKIVIDNSLPTAWIAIGY